MGVWLNHQVAVGSALWLSYLYLLWPLHLWLRSLPTIPCSCLLPGFSESLICKVSSPCHVNPPERWKLEYVGKNDLPGLVGEVFPLPSCFGHCPGGHVHHPSSSGHLFKCLWHAKIHAIHGSTFVYNVVGGSAEHGLSDDALHERLDPAMERFWVTIRSVVCAL